MQHIEWKEHNKELLSIYSILIEKKKMIKFIVVQVLSYVWIFLTPWTVAYQAPLSMVISK